MRGIAQGPALDRSGRRWGLRASALAVHPRRNDLVRVVALAVLYRGAAEIGYTLQIAGPVAAIVWLPVGVGMAFLYVCGLRYWPGVLIGDLLANDYGALPLASALGQTAGNLLEVVVAAALLRALVPSGDPLGSIGGLGRMLLAIAAGTAVSATVGSCASLLGDVIRTDDLSRVWRTWWLGDASGALIVLPLALAWSRPAPSWWRHRGAETTCLLLVIAGLSALTLTTSQPLTYLVFPALIWSALRLGQRGATVTVAVAACFAIWETTRREGSFAFESVTDSVLATQLYLAVSALSALTLAAVVSERQAFANRLAASRARLVDTGARERRRIEQDLHDGAQQRLIALHLTLQRAVEKVGVEPEAAMAKLEAAEHELAEAIDELRNLAHGIHPSGLTDHGLAHALADLAARSAIPTHLVEVPAGRIDATAEVTAYFVISEAVANAHKHAHASAIDVRAEALGSVLHLEVSDDGVGAATEDAGSGLQGLRDRVEALDGSFDVVSPAGRGTRIIADLPTTAPP